MPFGQSRSLKRTLGRSFQAEKVQSLAVGITAGKVDRVKLWIWIGIGAVLAVPVVGCKATRAGYESPRYTRIKKDGKSEIRDYPAMVVVSTPMAGVERGMEGGFGRPFRYISGENEGGEKIAMTTPVLIAGSTNAEQMSFIFTQGCGAGRRTPPRRNEGNCERAAGWAICCAALSRFAFWHRTPDRQPAFAGVGAAAASQADVIPAVCLLRSAVDTFVPAPERGHGEGGEWRER